MKRKVMILSLCLIVFSALSFAGEKFQRFETRTVFVPDIPKEMLADWIRAGWDAEAIKKFAESETGKKITLKEANAILKKEAEAIVSPFVDDINQLTKEGWEIKSARRAWVDFPPKDRKPSVSVMGDRIYITKTHKQVSNYHAPPLPP